MGPLPPALAASFLLWALSRPLFGRAEPWDVEMPLYAGVLPLCGILIGVLWPGRPVAAYLGFWSGQLAALVVLPGHDAGWLSLGVVTTGIGSLLGLGGYAAAAVLTRLRGIRRNGGPR
ncbi:MAG TPA: hypothetical protein DEH78_26635 [Solibacterales bacterium]|nr:hypothetical protein [Bryobacterales bacterium]